MAAVLPLAMLVGQEPVIEDTLKVKLAARGWRVETVRGGGAALALIRSRQPAVIILEAHLNDMEGYSFAQHLKDTPDMKTIPLIVLTADPDTVKTPYLYNTLAKSYIRLPFSPSAVTKMVDALIHGA